MFKKLKNRVKDSKIFVVYRKLRYILKISPILSKIFGVFKHYIGGLYNRIDEHHVFLLSGGLAFSLFVCVVPFMLIIFSVLGNILDSESMQLQLNTLIDTMIPYYKYAEYVKKIIFTRVNEVVQYKNIAGILGGFGLLFAASGLFSSMRTILSKVYNVEIESNVLLSKLKDFAFVLVVVVIFFLTTFLMPILDLLRQLGNQFEALEFFQAGVFQHFFFSLISITLIFIIFTLLYFTIPVKKIGRKTILFSAMWAAILWEAAKQAFGYYIYNFGTLGRIYGTYALIVVVAFWIYYTAVVFIIGAEMGRLYFERKTQKISSDNN